MPTIKHITSHLTIMAEEFAGIGTKAEPALEQEQVDEKNVLPKPRPEAAPPQSAFAEYTSFQIVRKFWRLYAFGMGVSLGGMYAGYCGSAIGNIVANQGEPA